MGRTFYRIDQGSPWSPFWRWHFVHFLPRPFVRIKLKPSHHFPVIEYLLFSRGEFEWIVKEKRFFRNFFLHHCLSLVIKVCHPFPWLFLFISGEGSGRWLLSQLVSIIPTNAEHIVEPWLKSGLASCCDQDLIRSIQIVANSAYLEAHLARYWIGAIINWSIHLTSYQGSRWFRGSFPPIYIRGSHPWIKGRNADSPACWVFMLFEKSTLFPMPCCLSTTEELSLLSCIDAIREIDCRYCSGRIEQVGILTVETQFYRIKSGITFLAPVIVQGSYF